MHRVRDVGHRKHFIRSKKDDHYSISEIRTGLYSPCPDVAMSDIDPVVTARFDSWEVGL